MKIKRTRQILKTLADDTRLRIINLLKGRKLSVTDICQVLGKEQSNISKHLTRLRLTGIVIDKRRGNNVYYCLEKPSGTAHRELVNVIVNGLKDIDVFKNDIGKLEKIKTKIKKKRNGM
jgi:ArsR family transcriptional regulator